jgi:hypothetical protein
MTSAHTSNVPTTPDKPKQTPLPDVGDIVFGAMVFLTLYLRPNFVFGDGSTSWHILTGEWILRHHDVPKADFFSVLTPGAHWVAYEWFADLLMACLVKIGGLNLLAVGVCTAIAGLFLLLYERMRKSGCHFVTALVVTIIGAFTSAVHWLARPHIFTFYGVYIFSTRLEDYYKGSISGMRFYLPVILFMLVWVNSHPAFLIGFALIGLYWCCALISAAVYAGERRQRYLKMVKELTIVGVACLGVTMLNPNGVELYKYLLHYFKGNSVIQATEEYMSPNFHGVFSPICLVVLYALFVIGSSISVRKLSFPKLMTCLVFAFLSLLSVRHMPLFVIVVLPAMGELFSRVRSLSLVRRDLPEPDIESSATTIATGPITALWWNALVAKLKEVGDGFNENEAICQMHLLPLIVVLGLGAASIFAPNTIVTSQFDPDDKPTLTLVRLYELVKKDGKRYGAEHGINFDNWGGYIYYKSLKENDPPEAGQRVWIDDRADFHGERHYEEYAQVSQVMPEYKSVLERYKTNWLLFPPNARIVAELKAHPDEWEELAHDKAAVLMVRKKPL